MHILYLDDSGSVGNANDKHIVLAGFSVFERQPYWLTRRIETIAEECVGTAAHSLELHANEMISGRKGWRKIDRSTRERLVVELLRLIGGSREVTVFAVAVHKASVAPRDPMEVAFEQICMRFDKRMGRLHKHGDTQRGIIILDKSTYETSLQSLARRFGRDGHSEGRLRNLAEVPLFVDSQATRMIQLADIVAYSVRCYSEAGDARFFDVIKSRFDAEDGIIHGFHHEVDPALACGCHGCANIRKLDRDRLRT